ncbi:MAG: hypothetical protein ACJAT4_002180 [Granulosicoccus sp.]|jgi:hypothetical protein
MQMGNVKVFGFNVFRGLYGYVLGLCLQIKLNYQEIVFEKRN